MIRLPRNVIERIAILENDDHILPEHLPPEISGARPSGPTEGLDVGSLFPMPLHEVESMRRRRAQALGRQQDEGGRDPGHHPTAPSSASGNFLPAR